jgi:hypothetical protein
MQLEPLGARLQHPVERLAACQAVSPGSPTIRWVHTSRPRRRARRTASRYSWKPWPRLTRARVSVEGGLQPQLQPHHVAPIPVVREQIQHRVGHAVGARADTQADHARLGQRRVVQGTQALQFRVGVGVGLEIGQIPARAGASRDHRTSLGQLAGHVAAVVPLGREARVVAERAAAASAGAVHVGTDETGADRKLVHPLPVARAKGRAEGVHTIGQRHGTGPSARASSLDMERTPGSVRDPSIAAALYVPAMTWVKGDATHAQYEPCMH